MECINSARALLQAAADDSYVVLDSNPSAAAAPTAAASAAPWQDTQEIQILLSLLGAYLLFFGQCGFALQEAGCVRSSVAKQVPFKALLQASAVLIVWWAVGHAFAFGERQGDRRQPNGFIGSRDFFLSVREDPAALDVTRFGLWMMQATFAATAVAIISGAVAERARLVAHALLSLIFGGWVYPVVVHWVWSAEGWLSARREAGGPILGGNGLIDLGGSGVVHVTAGAAALAGAYAIGARQGRFYADGGSQPMPAGSMVLVAAGVLMRWFSFYGLIPSNVPLMATSSAVYIASRAAVSATLAGAAGAAAAAGLDGALRRHIDHRPALDGAMAGLVAISAGGWWGVSGVESEGPCGAVPEGEGWEPGASVVEPYAAFLIGALAAPLYLASVWAVHALQIDDPVNAAAVHLLPGCWGLVAAGLFATPELLALSGYAVTTPRGTGLLYGGDGRQLALQLLGAAMIAAWSLAWSVAAFLGMRRAKLLRVGVADEMIGGLVRLRGRQG
ncbi:Ammonium transporter 1 member 2 [Monoraphidium neglectum]|uniref:Ammonium transporter 1 member 2 n=1 Tax=Monoraphidium neglectum TaxID=145388 RepID=A0A0D2MBB6_9CHLO|nr:Ammonium transporter 1 member 2 [Monoraphidium neglectum]KIY98146.1 Ammonium transporter 1 member 2 [Monoraphidium neglectum]|eukprot:XP_013897166.1 Ammonium transporter 1 member 2 [Monoraphidium neglectum]